MKRVPILNPFELNGVLLQRGLPLILKVYQFRISQLARAGLIFRNSPKKMARASLTFWTGVCSKLAGLDDLLSFDYEQELQTILKQKESWLFGMGYK